MKFFKVHIILLLLIGLLAPVHAQTCVPETKPGKAVFVASSADAMKFLWLVDGDIKDTTEYPDTTFIFNFENEGIYEVSVIPVSDSGVWGNDTTKSIHVFKNYDDMSVVASWTNPDMNVCEKDPSIMHNVVNINLTMTSDLIMEGEEYYIVYTIDGGAERTITFDTRNPSFDIDLYDLEDSRYHEFSLIQVFYGSDLQCVSNYRTEPQPMSLTLRNTPTAEIGQDIEVCQNDSFSFKIADYNTSYEYLWNNSVIDSMYSGKAYDTDSITLQVSSEYCSGYDTVLVLVHPLPATLISDYYTGQVVRDTLLCGDQTITLDAGTKGMFFDWSTGEITNTIVVQALDPFGKDTIRNIRVSIESDHNCMFTDSINIIRCVPPTKDITPTAFTPNGDGKNDCWEIPFLDNFSKATIDVYDRWGRVVFHSIGYETKWCGDFNGAAQPMDNYFYIIKVSPEAEPFYGNVMLVR